MKLWRSVRLKGSGRTVQQQNTWWMFVWRDVFCGSIILFLNVWPTAVVSNRRMEKTEVCLSLYSGREPGRAARAGSEELWLVKTDHVTWTLASDWTSAVVSSWGSYHHLSRRSQSGFRMIIFMMRAPYCFYWDDEISNILFLLVDFLKITKQQHLRNLCLSCQCLLDDSSHHPSYSWWTMATVLL